ncbi:MAG: MW1434 family type I TA system toxin [Staphylococcus pseudoxylosus]|uniref:Thoeris anti-defense Tad2 family protein n=1 Tax=Staphylococcus pseudoxylosus TaxID=2282419 RepID=UPI0031F6F737
MNIQEATKIAMEKGKAMYRRDFKNKGFRGEILPTNSLYHGLLYTIADKKSYKQRWQPMAEDLIADDWEVVGLNPSSLDDVICSMN